MQSQIDLIIEDETDNEYFKMLSELKQIDNEIENLDSGFALDLSSEWGVE